MIVHTPTPEDYVRVVKWAINKNIELRWISKSRSTHEEYWTVYCSETCVLIMDNIISYGNKRFVIHNYGGEKILDMEQFYKYTRKDIVRQFGEKFDLR